MPVVAGSLMSVVTSTLLLDTRNFEVPLSMKLIDPLEAMLLMRYSCVELLNPWNCPSAPFWS